MWYMLTNTDDIELEAALQQLLLNLVGDAVEADVALWEDGLRSLSAHGRHCVVERVTVCWK